MSGFCIYQYALDKDKTKVAFRTFQDTEKDIYPSISFCFNHPFDQSVINKSNIAANATMLRGLISGEEWFDYSKMNVKYDEVTLNLNEYSIDASIHPFGSEEDINTKPNDKSKMTFYVSQRTSSEKCFALDIPFMEKKTLSHLKVALNISAFIFNFTTFRGLRILPHYPNQSMSTAFNSLPVPLYRVENGNKLIKRTNVNAFVAHMDVIKRRNKHMEPCNTDWKHHDEILLGEILNQVGCKPFHLDSSEPLPVCTTKEEHYLFDSMVQNIIKQLDRYSRACREIEKTYYQFQIFTEESDLLAFKTNPETFFKRELCLRRKQIDL